MKPQDFFLTIRDFLAVLIPGIVLLYALYIIAVSDPHLSREMGGILSRTKTPRLPGLDLLVFAVAGYGVGSFIYSVGSLLDHFHRRYGDRLRGKARAEKLDQFEKIATQVRKAAIQSVLDCDAAIEASFSNRSFFTDYLRIACPTAASQLDRAEATQKLFRTFSVVFVIIAAFAAFRLMAGVAIVALLDAVLCLFAYIQGRNDWEYKLVKWVFLLQIKNVNGPESHQL